MQKAKEKGMAEHFKNLNNFQCPHSEQHYYEPISLLLVNQNQQTGTLDIQPGCSVCGETKEVGTSKIPLRKCLSDLNTQIKTILSEANQNNNNNNKIGLSDETLQKHIGDMEQNVIKCRELGQKLIQSSDKFIEYIQVLKQKIMENKKDNRFKLQEILEKVLQAQTSDIFEQTINILGQNTELQNSELKWKIDNEQLKWIIAMNSLKNKINKDKSSIEKIIEDNLQQINQLERVYKYIQRNYQNKINLFYKKSFQNENYSPVKYDKIVDFSKDQLFDSNICENQNIVGAAQYDNKGNIWKLNGGHVIFQGLQCLPERNFSISLEFKTSQKDCGVFSIGKDGHDRHFCIKNGQPYHRVWKGGGWTGNSSIKLHDNKWHKWELIVEDQKGQKAFIDGKQVGSNGYDHSDFNWKSEIRIGFSEDHGPNMQGEIKNIRVKHLKEQGQYMKKFWGKENSGSQLEGIMHLEIDNKQYLLSGILKNQKNFYINSPISKVFDCNQTEFQLCDGAQYNDGVFSFKTKNSKVYFKNMEYLPEHNFKISLKFKTFHDNWGIFSIGTNGHDRHLCLKNGQPYQRVWKGSGWVGKRLKNYNDNNWHCWELSVQDGNGQVSKIDGEIVGTDPYDHSDFNWKSEIRLGYSEDMQDTHDKNNAIMGEIQDVSISVIGENGCCISSDTSYNNLKQIFSVLNLY